MTWNWFILISCEVALTITVFPTEAIMSVSGIVVIVIIVEMQGLPATITLFKVSSRVHHRWQILKPLTNGV